MEEVDKLAEGLAKKAKEQGDNDLAIILHVYLGSKHIGMSSEFARHSQAFAKDGLKTIKEFRNRKNN